MKGAAAEPEMDDDDLEDDEFSDEAEDDALRAPRGVRNHAAITPQSDLHHAVIRPSSHASRA